MANDGSEMRISQDSTDMLARELGNSFAGSFGIQASIAREDALREHEDERKLADLRRVLINSTVDAVKNAQKSGGERAQKAVQRVCDKARDDALKRLDADQRMPVRVPYEQICKALLGYHDSDLLLRRIDQTLSKAEEQIVRSQSLDPSAAMSDCVNFFLEEIRPLGGVKVAEASDTREEEALAGNRIALRRRLDGLLASSNKTMEESIRGAFSNSMGEQATEHALDGTDFASKAQMTIEQALKAVEAVEVKAYQFRRTQAEEVAGQSLEVDQFPAFKAGADVERKYDVVEVALLSKEVRRSFATYRQILNERGLFAAFPEEDEADDEDQDEAEASRFLSDLDDDPKTALEHMRKANAHKYGGILDDEFTDCVDAFWYGLGELVTLANDMVTVNTGGLNVYLSKVGDEICARAFELGIKMDRKQLKAFQRDVRKAGKG